MCVPYFKIKEIKQHMIALSLYYSIGRFININKEPVTLGLGLLIIFK